ncbi:hypothetical protein JHK82_018240 [Glycine max]|nr:hypothetical protein JHK85_018666 [Glycine max]KAG5142545.1 hypothetical protein JHK82_018240 [Glycine max]
MMFAQKKVTLSPGRHKIVILDEADRRKNCEHSGSLSANNMVFCGFDTQPSYIASLTSILIVEQLSSSNYLTEELNIHRSRLLPLNSPSEYEKALKDGPANVEERSMEMVTEIERGLAERNAMKIEENRSPNAVHRRGFNFDDARIMRRAWRNEPNPNVCKVKMNLLLYFVLVAAVCSFSQLNSGFLAS